MKYLILGAGPAGLTVANRLKMRGVTDFLVLEKESEAGGLCRSIEVDGAPLDIGGGHFLDVRRPKVNDFLFEFMPENEWNLFDRDSQIAIQNYYIGHPIEANIWQMNIEEQIQYLKSIAIAGCNIGKEMPARFTEWIKWKLGSKIAEDYMIPYNQKMFGKELDELGTYWLEKLPNVSFEETLRSCLMKRAYGEEPGHTQFYYPKQYGYGEVWKRMADGVQNQIIYSQRVNKIDFDTRIVETVTGEKYQAEYIITTIPWTCFDEINSMPKDMVWEIDKLKSTSIYVNYRPEILDTRCQWIYYPDPQISYHRILVRHNFCPNSRGYWTETNAERMDINKEDIFFFYKNDYAYPLNTTEKPQIMGKMLKWCKKHNVIGLGRWGEHQHYNSDLVVELGMNLVDGLLK